MPKQLIFTEPKAEQFLAKYVKVAKAELTKNKEQALKSAKTIKFPLVLKIISQQALHKTEVGGIKLCKDEQALQSGYDELLSIAKKKHLKLDGIYAQEFVSGKELIVGIKKDETFGHVIMLGIGGIFVEVLKDVTFRSCPITDKDAQSMIDDLKGKQLLFGARNQQPINLNKLKQTLVKISEIPLKHKTISELDINPLIINEKDAVVADARIVFE